MLQRQQTIFNMQASLQQKPSAQNLNRLNSHLGAINLFTSGELPTTNHLKNIHYEYDSVQEGIQELQDMIKYAVENHENVVKDKFLVKKNRLSRKKREIYEQEMQLQRQEMELNSNPSIKKALFDLSQLKEFYGRKEKQYQMIQEVINKEDETLQALKSIHEKRIQNLKVLISTTIDTQLRIDKMKKYIKYKRSQQNMTTTTQHLYFEGIPSKNNTVTNATQQDHVLITQSGYLQNNPSLKSPQSKISKGVGLSLENIHQSQLPTVNSSTTQNKNISQSIINESNAFRNVGQILSTSSSTKHHSNRYANQSQNNSNSHIQNKLRANTFNSNSVPTLLRNIKQTDNILTTNSSIIDQNSMIHPKDFNQNASSILVPQEFEDINSIEQSKQILKSEYDQIKKEIVSNRNQVERKKQFIYKHCNNYLQKNELIKECFNLVSKKLSSTRSMSDKKGFRDSMYLSFKSNNLFITQNDQIINDFKDFQHNLNVNVQDRLLGSIVFDSMMNLIKKQETEKLQKHHSFPHISYKNFSQFNLGQILTLMSLKPELKEQLFIPFELKKQTIHLLQKDIQRII